jgi:phosphoesterase RecJ-like protein
MALALALRGLGKNVRTVLRDPVPGPYRMFPEVDTIEHRSDVSGAADAAVLLECSDLSRPDLRGLEPYFKVNVDHHLGNRMYGDVNWFDESAAACGEMVADVIDALGVRWTPEIAQHLFLAISTDTGGFRYGPMSARTFEICRRVAECGVDTAALSRQIFDSYSIGRVRIMGAMLNAMELHDERRLAVLAFDDELLARCGAVPDDTEGLVNIPLSAAEVSAVALFKRQSGNTYRVSLRSKGAVDVRSVAERWDGGGHRNAAGCTITGEYAALHDAVIEALREALGEAAGSHPSR